MKASVLTACLLVAGAAFVTTSAAQAAPQKAKPATTTATTAHAEKASTAAAKAAWASGAVEKFDQASRTLVLKHDGKESTYVLAENASVMNGKQKAALTDLASGKNVKVEYTVANGANTASLVELEGAKAKHAKAAPKK
jgi:Cu/Ag efflux protein CusF